MRRTEDQIRGLTERLTIVAEVIPGARAPTARAVLTWIDALEDCDPVDVYAALDEWLRTKTKAPAPAEIRAIAIDRGGARRERQAREKVRTDAGFDLEHPPANPVEALTPEARAAYDELRTMLANGVRLFKPIPDAEPASAATSPARAQP